MFFQYYLFHQDQECETSLCNLFPNQLKKKKKLASRAPNELHIETKKKNKGSTQSKRLALSDFN
jgi:hypothetical protein